MLICRFFRKYWWERAINLKILLPALGPPRWPVCSFDPMTSPSGLQGHMRSHSFFASNIWYNRDKALGMVPMCFSRTDAVTDMQHDLLGSSRDHTWPWPEVKVSHWYLKVKLYIFRRILTSGTRCCQNYVTSFLSSKVISEKKSCKSVFLTFIDLCSLTRWR